MVRVRRLAFMTALAVAPFAVTLASPALAQPVKSDQARDHVRAGLAYAERDKWEDALREFEEAYALDPQPLRLYDVAQARLKTKRYRGARDAFTQLVQQPGLSPEQRDRARAGLATATDRVARLRITIEGGTPGDAVTVDGSSATSGAPNECDPGRRVVRLVRGGEVLGERTVDVPDGGDVPVTIAPSPSAASAPPGGVAPPAAAPQERAPAVPTLAIVLGGVAIVAGGLGAYFEVRGLGRWSDLRDSCGKTKTCAPGDVDGARGNMLAGDIAIGVGIAAAVAAVYVYFARPGEHDKRIGLTPGAGGFTAEF